MSLLTPHPNRWKIKALGEGFGCLLAEEPVCCDHHAPLDIVTSWILSRPPISITEGPRGGGKSFGSGFAGHIDSCVHRDHHTLVLGGSESQSKQIYDAVRKFAMARPDVRPIVTATKAQYPNGSDIEYIACSPKSVRGPHVQTLCVDEADEIDRNLREAAYGMVMDLSGVTGQIRITSTYHNVGGPMASLIEQAQEGKFPYYKFCAFETLQRCPDEISGPNLENCPRCPLVEFCHSDRDQHPSGLPKAKRSRGHYSLNSLAHKAIAQSPRVFASDFLCTKPRSEALWFTAFDRDVHVGPEADYDRNYAFHCSIDTGLECGAVWLQCRPCWENIPIQVTIFDEYYGYDLGHDANARNIVAQTESRCGVGIGSARVSIDPACSQREGSGIIARSQFEWAGCQGHKGLEFWPKHTVYWSKNEGLNFVDSLLRSASGAVALKVHPRCHRVINAFEEYRRNIRQNQIMDEPAPVQHPHEEMIDPLVGALKLEYPAGRKYKSWFERDGNRRPAGSVI